MEDVPDTVTDSVTDSVTVYDYCIVGGGVLGCAIGKTLLEKEPDAKILIVEKFANAGFGNSSRSNALYRNIFDTELNIQISASSLLYYGSEEAKGEDFGRREIGYLFLWTQEQYDTYLEPSLDHQGERLSFFDFLDAHSIDYEVFNAVQLKQRWPDLELEPTGELAEMIAANKISWGFWGKNCGAYLPDLVVKHYLKKFMQMGGQTLYNTRVTALKLGAVDSAEFDPDYVPAVWQPHEIKAIEVDRDGQSSYIHSKRFVLATGAWINQLLDPLGGRSMIKAKKRQLFTIDHVSDFIFSNNFSQDHSTIPFVILPTGGVYIKPLDKAGALVVGTSDKIGRSFAPTYSLRGDRDLDAEMDDPQAEDDFFMYNILPIMQAYFPGVFDDLTKIKGSAGHYAYSIDGNPVIDKVKGVPNLFFASGASGSGIMKADSIARLCAAVARGEPVAKLFNGTEIDVRIFGVETRDLPDETLVL
ncbi:MAG: NAD(P)/FAD-dependent oxidoreductase [Candidatus Kariarchaeaceae archaeon]|jgi:glycine/D-amino acid oxidase-like deaminating enzyme